MQSSYQLTLRNAVTSWKNFDVQAIQHSFHDQLSAITNTTNKCFETRKEIARKTKVINELKSLLTEDKFSLLANTIKSYQSYIDDLTRRSVFSENIITSLSSKFESISDPVSFFEETNTMYKSYLELTEKFEYFEKENKKLSDEAQVYEHSLEDLKQIKIEYENLQKEYEHLKQQHESDAVLVQQYQSSSSTMSKKDSYIQKLELRDKSNNTEIEGLRKELTVLQDRYNELKKNDNIISLQGQIDILTSQLSNSKGDIEKHKEEYKLLETSFNDYKQQCIRETDGLKNTISMLNQELENITLKYNINDFYMDMNGDNSSVASSLLPSTNTTTTNTNNNNNSTTNTTTNTTTTTTTTTTNNNNNTSTKQTEVGINNLELLEQIDQLKQDLLTQQIKYETQINTLEQTRKTEILQYTTKLSEYQKLLSGTISNEIYTKLMRCFAVLQKAGVNIDYSDATSFVTSSNYIITNTEKLLLNKIDLLQKHNIDLRKKYNELFTLHEKTQSTLSLITERERDLTELNNQLEIQLTEQQQQLQQLHISRTNKENISFLNSELDSDLETIQPLTPTSTINTKSFETMIKEQRDRYKNKVDELEIENAKYKQQIQQLLAQLDTNTTNLKQRNSKYSYSSKGMDPEMNISSSAYYSRLYHGKNPLDRGVILIAEETLSNTKCRHFLIIYMIILHLFFLYTFFHMSYSHM